MISLQILRPHWDESTSADALQQAEKDSFLEWRRELAQYVLFCKLSYLCLFSCLLLEKLRVKPRTAFVKHEVESVWDHECQQSNWSCYLSRLEEEQKLILTPFERNLEFWRQLWRVIERR